jgi:hypothetical protein
MEDFDLSKSLDDLLRPTDLPKAAALKNITEALSTDLLGAAAALTEESGGAEAALTTELATDSPEAAAFSEKLPSQPPEGLKNATEAPNLISLESILARLSPEGQAWLNGLNRFCRRAVEYDLRTGPNRFVTHWESLRDTLQRLERDLGPSDNWM